MNKRIIQLIVVILIANYLTFPKPAQAVIPPDFVFSIGTQITQFFTIILISLTAVFGAFYQFFKLRYQSLKHKKLILALALVLIVLASLGSAYFYGVYRQRVEYDKWLKESQEYSRLMEGTDATSTAHDYVDKVVDEQEAIQEDDFFELNQDRDILVSNDEFKKSLEADRNELMILDAREDVEYENGNFPGSLHIRFADLKAGGWVDLPKDKNIYVFCWSGIRGKEVAEFLRTKKLVSFYLEDGANGWVEYGGEWDGSIKFSEAYSGPNFSKVFATDEVKKEVAQGAVLVDSREPSKFAAQNIYGIVNISTMYTPTVNMEEVFAQVPPHSKVIAVCDDYVNCFDAKITGAELEKRGHEFLGRYNKPWEYER